MFKFEIEGNLNNRKQIIILKPQKKKGIPYKPPFNFLPHFIGIAVLIALVQFMLKTVPGTDEKVVIDERGVYQHAEKEKQELENRIEQEENCVQYVARARDNGYRDCYSCPPPQIKIYLRTGEVWRYGETCDFQERQKAKEYVKNKTFLSPQYYGNRTSCYQEQLRKIYNYRLHPENMERLVNKKLWLERPPGNRIKK